MIAALFVIDGGCYYGLDGVLPYSEFDDARLYDGPWPVVAHPPCERWGAFAHGSPLNPNKVFGDDGGCFAHGMYCCRKYGGVIEHPYSSRAFQCFYALKPTKNEAWFECDDFNGYACYVDQGNYGHLARKPTILYVNKGNRPKLDHTTTSNIPLTVKSKNRKNCKTSRAFVDYLPVRHRNPTPVVFRDILIQIARSCS